MWWQKLVLVLMVFAAVGLGWARGATPAQAAGPTMSLGATGSVLCDDSQKPTACVAQLVPSDPKAGEFSITVNANVIPGSYGAFSSEVFLGGLTYNERSCSVEMVWPEKLLLCVKAIGAAGQVQFGRWICLFWPCYPVSTYVGALVELNVHCPAQGQHQVALTAWPSSLRGARYYDKDGVSVLMKPAGQQELDLDGDTVPETVDVADTLTIICANPLTDTDSDGCSDLQEQAFEPQFGGLRDPSSYWDFYDTPDASNVRDKAVTIGDIFAIIPRFGATGDPGGDPLAGPIPPAPGYHTAFDRGEQVGENSWNRAPADGAITIQDIFAVAAQFGHDCR
jgi:hypothetical protein